MSRRILREQLFKLLFRVEFNDLEEMQEQCGFFFDDIDNPISEQDMVFIQEKFNGIMEKLGEIDSQINEHAKGWTTDRMAKVDLTIIRLAVYEMDYSSDVPYQVAINEAIELSKIYCDDNAPKVINGVLDTIKGEK